MPRDEIEALLRARPSLVLLHAKSYFNNTRSSWDEGAGSGNGGGSGGSGGGEASGAARRVANGVLFAVAAAAAARLVVLAARSSRTRFGAAAQRK
jgi:hypothetical protein